MRPSLRDKGQPELREGSRRPEPRRITVVDLLVITAGVAVVLAMPTRTAAWPPFLAPPPLLALVVIGGLRLTVMSGLVLSLAVLYRRGLYGGPVRPAEWLAM